MNDLFRNIWVFIFAMAISGCTNPTPPGTGVVALTPALTEVVLELGKGDQLIATSTYTTDERAAKVRRIPTNGILEIVTAMHPRFVLTQGNESVMTQKFEKMQIETLVLPMTTTDDIEHAVMTVGKALNAQIRRFGDARRLGKQSLDLRHTLAAPKSPHRRRQT